MKKHRFSLVLLVLLFLLFLSSKINAQVAVQSSSDSIIQARITELEKKVAFHKPGLSRLVVVGLTTFGYVSSNTTNTSMGVSQTSKSGVMGGADTYEFSPMFLWRQGKKVLLEFEPSFNNDGLSVNWANISYFARPNVILRGGYFVLPFGIYNKKLAAGWINKLATDPIGLPTGADYGVGASGGVQMGSIKWNYDISVTNGMSLGSDGQLQSVNLNSNSRGKTLTGRLGLLPLSNNSLEIGVSGMTGAVANGNPQFKDARADLYAFDLNYVKNISLFQVNVKSQYNIVNVSSQSFVNPSDTTKTYSFSNQSNSGYGQFSIRPVGLTNKYLKNVELAFRYANSTTPANSTWGAINSQIDYGINYWFNWRTVLRVSYEMLDTKTSVNSINTNQLRTQVNALHIQFSIQL